MGDIFWASGSGQGEVSGSQKNSAEEKEEKNTTQRTLLGGACAGSLWLCYARSLTGREKSRI